MQEKLKHEREKLVFMEEKLQSFEDGELCWMVMK